MSRFRFHLLTALSRPGPDQAVEDPLASTLLNRRNSLMCGLALEQQAGWIHDPAARERFVENFPGSGRSAPGGRRGVWLIPEGSMSNEIRPGVTGFFETYRAAFEALDAPAITDLFTYPLHIASDGLGEVSLTVIETRDEWSVQVEQLLELYRAIGFASARILELAVTGLSARLAQAVVDWGLYDGTGGSLYDFKAMYTLVMIHGSLRIAAISHDEIPKYRASLARLK